MIGGSFQVPNNIKRELGAAVLLLCAGAAWAAAGDPLTGELPVNELSAGNQTQPAIAVDPVGNTVIVWQDDSADGDGSGILARRFSPTGVALGPSFIVNTLVAGEQSSPDVAMLDDGRFAVVWASNPSGADPQIRFRSYAADGSPLADELRIDPSTQFQAELPAIAADPQGRFSVVWSGISVDSESFGIAFRRISATGAGIGLQQRVNSTETNAQRRPAIDCGLDGGCVVAWQSFEQDGSINGIYAQRIDPAGALLGAEIAVNNEINNDQRQAQVQLLPSGQFSIVWSDSNIDGSSLRRFAADGSPLGPSVQLNLTDPGSQFTPSIASDAFGNQLIAWTSDGQDGDLGSIIARTLSADGSLGAEEIRINLTTAGDQDAVVVALDADGDAVLAWVSADQDGDGAGIFQRRFLGAAVLDLAAALSSDVSLIRPGGPLTFSARLNNLASPQTPTGVAARDAGVNAATASSLQLQPPADASLANGVAAGWNCSADGAVQNCALQSSIAAAGSGSVSFSATAPSTVGQHNFSLSVAGPHADPNSVNNSANRSITVQNPTLNLSPTSASIGEGGGSQSLTLSISPAAGSTLSVPYQLAGTATAGSDFSVSPASPISVPAGASSVLLSLQAIDDNLSEGDESLTLSLGSTTGAELGTATSASFTITDNEALPQLQFSTTASFVAENQGVARVRVVLNSSSANSVSLPFSLSGTAASSDYSVSPTSPLSIAAGELEAFISITPVDDQFTEDDESVVITLGTPSGASLGGRSQHSVLIRDNERLLGPPQLSFSSAGQQISEGATTATVIAQLSRPAPQALTIAISSSGSAIRGADYSAPASISFAADASQASFVVNLIDDSRDEDNESILLILQDNPGVVIGSPDSHEITVLDNDPLPTLSFVSSSSTVREGNRSLAVALQLNNPSGRDLSLNFSTAGSARSGIDFSALPELVIPAGETSASLSVGILADGIEDDDDSLIINLIAGTGYALGANAQHSITITEGSNDSSSGALPLPALLLMLGLALLRSRRP